MSMLSWLSQVKISPGEIGYNPSIRSGEQGLIDILNLVYFWAGVVAVIVIIVSALFFVTSRADANQMKRSKDALRGAVIGLIVVMLAFTITQFVLWRLR